MESWYLSANTVEGRVMNVCKLHVPVDAVRGGDSPLRGIVSFKVGCKPVGAGKLALYVDKSGNE